MQPRLVAPIWQQMPSYVHCSAGRRKFYKTINIPRSQLLLVVCIWVQQNCREVYLPGIDVSRTTGTDKRAHDCNTISNKVSLPCFGTAPKWYPCFTGKDWTRLVSRRAWAHVYLWHTHSEIWKQLFRMSAVLLAWQAKKPLWVKPGLLPPQCLRSSSWAGKTTSKIIDITVANMPNPKTLVDLATDCIPKSTTNGYNNTWPVWNFWMSEPCGLKARAYGARPKVIIS